MYKKITLLFGLFSIFQISYAQGWIPVYSDYLSDNYYLLHPSMAGAANCAKVRFTARTQWLDQDNAPALQTLSFNGRLGERSGLGFILFNDQNGFHSQKGAKFTYAHHLLFSRDYVDLNQLSFGVNASFVQSQLDETTWLSPNVFDPIVNGFLVQGATYFNLDIGASYNFLDFYFHGTIQNILQTERKIYTQFQSPNRRKLILSAGYVFGDIDNVLIEPSTMFQYTSLTNEKAIDINLKAYKGVDFGKVWAALSYRTSFDGAQYINGNAVDSQRLQYFTPILGINYKNLMFAYTYSSVMGDIKFDTAGFHQITLGFDLWCKREKYECNCPAIN